MTDIYLSYTHIITFLQVPDGGYGSGPPGPRPGPVAGRAVQSFAVTVTNCQARARPPAASQSESLGPLACRLGLAVRPCRTGTGDRPVCRTVRHRRTAPSPSRTRRYCRRGLGPAGPARRRAAESGPSRARDHAGSAWPGARRVSLRQCAGGPAWQP